MEHFWACIIKIDLIKASILTLPIRVLHQNKALHNFHQGGKHLNVRCMKDLDQGLFSALKSVHFPHGSTPMPCYN